MTGSEKLRSLEEQVETLTKERDEAIQAKTQADGELATALKAKTEAEEAKVKAEEELAGVTKIKAELAEKVTKLEGEAKTAEARAAEMAAQFGGAPGKKAADEGTGENAGGAEILEQLQAIKDPQARTAFFRANRKAIDAANAKLKAKTA